jgi:5-methyltetrahydropteroyltriglutamate--homocysteine methyltransferase
MFGSVDRILTTHVGSLVRPADVVSQMRAVIHGEPYEKAALQETLRRAIQEVVNEQARLGIDIVNDGEFGKSGWSAYVLERLEGFEHREVGRHSPRQIGLDRKRFSEFYAEEDLKQERGTAQSGWVITRPIRYLGQLAISQDIQNLQTAMRSCGAERGFMAVVAPGSVLPDHTNEYYPDEATSVFAIAEAMREEYHAVVDAGLTVQVDDAWMPAMYERMVPPATLADYYAWAELRVEALNHALHGIPLERSRYHVCWGSWNGPHTGDIPLTEIVHLILKVRVGGYAIEAANPRHEHEWRVWKTTKLPAERVLIPGVVSHATNVVEHPELVADRVVRFANLVGRERVIAGTDCGFAQGALYRRVHPSIMWAKLQSVVDGARIATKRLWG